MNFEREIEELGEKLMNDEISLEEHLRQYNRLIESESDTDDFGWQPHEHI